MRKLKLDFPSIFLIRSTHHRLAVIETSHIWSRRIGSQVPEFYLSPDAAAMLRSEGEERFYETFGYYYLESHDRISTVSILYHFQSSSADNATWSAINSNLKVNGGAWNANDVALAVDHAMSGQRATANVSVTIHVVVTGLPMGIEQTFHFPSQPSEIEAASRRVWNEAVTRSTIAAAIPYNAHLASYRSIMVPGRSWAEYRGVPMTIKGKVFDLNDCLKRLAESVAMFPSTTQQQRFQLEYSACQAAFARITGER